MERNQMKEELKGRYCYIYENAEEMLAPFMKYESRTRKGLFKNEKNISSITLGSLSYSFLLSLESFLLGDTPYKKSPFYEYFEGLKNDEEYKKLVKAGKNLVQEHNDNVCSSFFEISLDSWLLLVKLRQFIAGQKSGRASCVEKLHAMDEYFKIARYKNDGKIRYSGYSLDLQQDSGELTTDVVYNSPAEPVYIREVGDYGLDASRMVLYLETEKNKHSENGSILTEKEKQDIYLKYHDELPWNMEKTCELEEEYFPATIDCRLKRPEHTCPCGKTFYVKEEDIFVDPVDTLYRYYELCPHCGYIVNIRKETLPDTIKKRIDERCEKDPNLFRKKYLYSELISLEDDPFTRRRFSSK